MPPADRHLPAAGLPAAALLAVVIAYTPLWSGGWVWDDHQWADRVVDPGTLLTAADSLWRPLGTAPVLLLQWLLPAPWPHHLFSLGLHLVSVAAVAGIARACGARPSIAWLAAACFGLHAGASEPVAWMSCTTELVPAALTLVGWAALTRDRPWLAGVCFALTPFGKEAWLLLPVALLVWMWAAPRPSWRAWGLTVAGCVAYLLARPASFTPPAVAGFDPFGPLGAITLRGVALLLLPTTADVFPLYHPAPVVGAIATVAVLAAAAFARGRPAVAALLFGLPILAPNALAAAQTGIVADRYYYLPLACTAVAVALAGETLARRTMRPPRALVLLPVLLGVITFQRAAEWRTDATLFGASLAHDPTNPYAAFRLAHDLNTRQHRCAEAVPLYTIGIEADPRAISGLQACLTELGRLDEIVALAPRATTLAARKNLIRTYLTLGRVDEARTACVAAIDLFPADAPLRALYGAALGRAGDIDAAARAFDAALALDPTDPDAKRGRETVQRLRTPDP